MISLGFYVWFVNHINHYARDDGNGDDNHDITVHDERMISVMLSFLVTWNI